LTDRPVAEPKRWQRVAAAVAAIALVATLFQQGAQPYAVGLIPSPWDKLAHAALFGVLALLFWLIVPGRRPLAVVLIVTLIGAADEWAQLRLPGREPGLDDLAADLIGAVIAVCALMMRARESKRPKNEGEPT